MLSVIYKLKDFSIVSIVTDVSVTDIKDDEDFMPVDMWNQSTDKDRFPTIDLFQHFESLPDEVNDIINEFFEENNCYDNCALFVEKLEAVGYTCDYGLDAEPHSLTKL